MRRIVLGGLVVVCLVFPGSAVADQVGPPVIVTRDDGSLPARCDVRRTAEAVRAFFDGYGSGGLSREVGRYAPAPAFEWFSLGGPKRLFRSVYDRAALRRHLKRRRQVRERLQLTMIETALYERRRRLVHFQVRFTRTASDLPAAYAADPRGGGKGALRCRDGKLVVLSLAHDPQTPWSDPCPPPADLTAPQDAIVACSHDPGPTTP